MYTQENTDSSDTGVNHGELDRGHLREGTYLKVATKQEGL